MAAKKRLLVEYVIVDGPGLLELQFSEYNPQGHIVQFVVNDPIAGLAASRSPGSWTMYAQVIGTDKIERPMIDPLNRHIAGAARIIRITYNGVYRYQGWYDYRLRRGYLVGTGNPELAPVLLRMRPVNGSGSGMS